MQREMTAEMIFDYMGILLDKKAMEKDDFVMNFTITDTKEQYMLRVKNGVLLVFHDAYAEDADVSVTCPKNALFLILQNRLDANPDAVQVEGDSELLNRFMEHLNQFTTGKPADFNIIEP